MTQDPSPLPGLPDRAATLRLLDRYVRLPTVSGRIAGETVEAVRALWREQGLDLVPLGPPGGQGTPALGGEIPGPPGAPVLLLYGHYDVQPPGDLACWRWGGVPCDPFVPAYFVNEVPVEPWTLDPARLDGVTMVARGGADNKGQHAANLLGALAARRAGTLRWTVRVLLDGEEEHGSPHLAAIAAHHRDRLRAAVSVSSDGPKQDDRFTLVLGVRGLLEVHLSADNGRATAVHSGNYGNVVPNPVLPLARLVETLGARVRAHAERHGAFREAVEAHFGGEPGADRWRPFLWPTVNANHFASDGTSLAERRTVIPRAAHARLDVRLTPDTTPEAVAELVEAVVAEHRAARPDLRFEVRTAGQPASYTSPSRPEFAWLRDLLVEAGGEPPVVLPVLGGTLPTWVLTHVLGMPAFLLPSANRDNQQHDVNEHYRLRHFFAQIALYARIVSSRPG